MSYAQEKGQAHKPLSEPLTAGIEREHGEREAGKVRKLSSPDSYSGIQGYRYIHGYKYIQEYNYIQEHNYIHAYMYIHAYR